MPVLEADPFRDVANHSGVPLLVGLVGGEKRRWWYLDEQRDDLDPSSFDPCRRSTQFPGRRNYAGLYPFGLTGKGKKMVMFESLTELVCLMELDHGGHVAQIAAQPFGLMFTDGTRHYPDFAAAMTDGSTVVVDVRPALHAAGESFIRAAARTEDACRGQGWGFRVMSGCSGWEEANLEWLCAHRQQEYAPPPERQTALLEFLVRPQTMQAAAQCLDPRSPWGLGYPLLANMMFHRRVVPVDPGPYWAGMLVVAATEDPE